MRELADSQCAAHTPGGRDLGERNEHERPPLEHGVRNVELARSEPAAVPGEDVEVEHAGGPALARSPAEIAFDLLELCKHGGGCLLGRPPVYRLP